METLNYFNELFIINNLDPRLQQLVVGNLEKNFARYIDRELITYSGSLSAEVFEQLELSLMEKFMGSFKLFEKLDIKTIRLIKHHMLVENQKVLLKKGIAFKDL